MSEYTISNASVGIGALVGHTEQLVKVVASAMTIVETIVSLSGSAKKLAVIDMLGGTLANVSKNIEELSNLIDLIKTIYNSVKSIVSVSPLCR